VAFEYSEGLAEEVENLLWAAYSNPTSLWLTEESLVRMLFDVGFEYVSKVYVPRGYKCQENCQEECRIIVVAKKTATRASYETRKKDLPLPPDNITK